MGKICSEPTLDRKIKGMQRKGVLYFASTNQYIGQNNKKALRPNRNHRDQSLGMAQASSNHLLPTKAINKMLTTANAFCAFFDKFIINNRDQRTYIKYFSHTKPQETY